MQINRRLRKTLLKKFVVLLAQETFEKESKIVNEKFVKSKQRI